MKPSWNANGGATKLRGFASPSGEGVAFMLNQGRDE